MKSLPLMGLGNDNDCSPTEDVAKVMDKTMDDMDTVNPQGVPIMEQMEKLCTDVLDIMQRIKNLGLVLEL